MYFCVFYASNAIVTRVLLLLFSSVLVFLFGFSLFFDNFAVTEHMHDTERGGERERKRVGDMHDTNTSIRRMEYYSCGLLIVCISYSKITHSPPFARLPLLQRPYTITHMSHSLMQMCALLVHYSKTKCRRLARVHSVHMIPTDREREREPF